MKKTVEITALKDRETLHLKQGDKLTLELEGDALVKLYNEQMLGLIEIKELN